MCPFAYPTSLWLRNVRAATGLRVSWRFFSLEEINRFEGKKHPWERPGSYGWSLMQIGALLRRRYMALLDAWYAATGRELHEAGGKPTTRRSPGGCSARLAWHRNCSTRPSRTTRPMMRCRPARADHGQHR